MSDLGEFCRKSEVIMEELKSMAKAAKQRLKNNFWQECKKSMYAGEVNERQKGLNE